MSFDTIAGGTSAGQEDIEDTGGFGRTLIVIILILVIAAVSIWAVVVGRVRYAQRRNS